MLIKNELSVMKSFMARRELDYFKALKVQLVYLYFNIFTISLRNLQEENIIPYSCVSQLMLYNSDLHHLVITITDKIAKLVILGG